MGDSISRTLGQVEQLMERRDSLRLALGENDNPIEGLQAELEEQLEHF